MLLLEKTKIELRVKKIMESKYTFTYKSSKEIESLVKLKKYYYDKWKETGLETAKSIHKHYGKLVNKTIKKAYREAENKTIKDLARTHKQNILKFWKKVKALNKNEVKITIDMSVMRDSLYDTFNNKLIDTDDTEIMEKISQWQDEILQKGKGRHVINTDYIEHAFKYLKTGKLSGASGMSNEFFKYAGYEFMLLTGKFLEVCINNRILPSSINRGTVFPIIKNYKLPTDDINNIRPICVSDTLSLIFEDYCLQNIIASFDENPNQFGFRPNYSCDHGVFCLKELINHQRQRNKPVHMCFLDYTKAFDKLNRSKLSYKLHDFLDEDIWLIIKIYYEMSDIVIKLNGATSEPIKTTVGVKQGGKMSPKLYSIYINSMITEIINSGHTCTFYDIEIGIICYADDITICCDTNDKLQLAIKIIERYCEQHEITINARKTYVMVVGAKNEQSNITIKGKTIETCKKFKLLGVWLQDNLQNKEQIKMRKFAAFNASYALNNLGFDNKTMPVDLKLQLITIYCRSTLLYGMAGCDINKGEMDELQRTEAMILKRSLGLSKYSRTGIINRALAVRSMVDTIKERKLSLLVRLTQNNLCNLILEKQMEKMEIVNKKTLLGNTLDLLGIEINNFSLSMLGPLLDAHEICVEEEMDRNFEMNDSYLIRHCLENRCATNDQILKNVIKAFDRTTNHDK